MIALDVVRCEALAAAGFAAEATAVSATRVAIDRLINAYADFSYDDLESCRRLDTAIRALIGEEVEVEIVPR